MDRGRLPLGLLRAPLGHWIIAAMLAGAVAWGVRVWLGQNAARSSQTATLLWDAGAARQVDPNLADTAEPAVAMAQSILSDPVVAGLAQSASLAPSKSAVRIGEFRSRLELRESSANLQVQFRDANPQRAVQTANAVARALAAGTPAPAGRDAAVVPPQVEPPPPEPVKTPAASPASQASSALAESLGRLEAELSLTQRKLESLGSGAPREYAGESSSYRESKEQQLLTAQVGAALKEVAGLRADPVNGEAQEPLRRTQDALISVWPASRAGRGSRGSANFMGFNAAGVNASRLREERAQFAHVLEVVKKEQFAAQRVETAQAATPPAPAAPASPAAVPASSPSSGGNPAIAESDISKSPAQEPFRLLRPAGTPARAPLWPAVLGGFCCGTLYLAGMGLRYREDEEEDEAEYQSESAVESHRLITPAKPLRPADFFGSVELRSAEVPASVESRPPESTAGVETRMGEIIRPTARIERVDLAEDDTRGSIIDQELSRAAEETRRPFVEGIASEEGGVDPWVDNIIKSLSETSIGRMFEKPGDPEGKDDPSMETDSRRLSNHPDRLAG